MNHRRVNVALNFLCLIGEAAAASLPGAGFLDLLVLAVALGILLAGASALADRAEARRRSAEEMRALCSSIQRGRR